MKFRVRDGEQLRVENKLHKPGDEVEMTQKDFDKAAEAQPSLKRILEPAAATKSASDPKDKEPPKAKEPSKDKEPKS